MQQAVCISTSSVGISCSRSFDEFPEHIIVQPVHWINHAINWVVCRVQELLNFSEVSTVNVSMTYTFPPHNWSFRSSPEAPAKVLGRKIPGYDYDRLTLYIDNRSLYTVHLLFSANLQFNWGNSTPLARSLTSVRFRRAKNHPLMGSAFENGGYNTFFASIPIHP